MSDIKVETIKREPMGKLAILSWMASWRSVCGKSIEDQLKGFHDMLAGRTIKEGM